MAKVIIGLSGGVDSAVSAYLLKKEGHEVLAIFMQNWEEDPYCTAKEDAKDAIAVAETLNIDLDIIKFSKEYKELVFNNFLTEYKLGRTPNPDILCNSKIKFGAFLEYAENIGADYIATGHYAKKITIADKNYLVTPKDGNKDQTYFLSRLNKEQLSKVLFPLAEFHKSEVRELAQKIKLPNALKKDSTGICFVGKRPFQEFLHQFLPFNPGIITDIKGNILGEHLGMAYYTIGQRKGLKIGGSKFTNDAWFVYKKDLLNNKLIVVSSHDNQLLYRDNLIATDLSFVNEAPITGNYYAKIRYRNNFAECTLDSIDSSKMQVSFKEKQWAITSGQSIVLYKDNICLGGGIIE